MMALSRVKRITGLPVRFGGIEHSGWLPPGAAEPAVTPMEEVIVDLEIVVDGSAYLLCWSSQDGQEGDSMYDSVEEAEKAAEEYFGATRPMWVE
jgi:hypothetical protein